MTGATGGGLRGESQGHLPPTLQPVLVCEVAPALPHSALSAPCLGLVPLAVRGVGSPPPRGGPLDGAGQR